MAFGPETCGDSFKRENTLGMKGANRLAVSVVLLTLLYWLSLIFKIPVFQSLPSWFWKFQDKASLDIVVFVPIFLFVPFLLMIIMRKAKKSYQSIIILILAGFSLQFAFVEKKGISALKDRMVATGHAEFARIASLPLSYPRGSSGLRGTSQKWRAGRLCQFETAGPSTFLYGYGEDQPFLLAPWREFCQRTLRKASFFRHFPFPFPHISCHNSPLSSLASLGARCTSLSFDPLSFHSLCYADRAASGRCSLSDHLLKLFPLFLPGDKKGKFNLFDYFCDLHFFVSLCVFFSSAHYSTFRHFWRLSGVG